MNYRECLDFLYSKLPMFSRIGDAAYKKSLDNILYLSEKLGNPHLNTRFIHVAGTNGKGSTSHMLAAVLQASGYKTGLYTSPHIHDFRERIRINGKMIEELEVIHFVSKIFPLDIEPSFFEATVAMAFDYFARNKVDVAVIETGLGGRLDSTNIIQPLLSVITNIGRDHMKMLGDTLPQIAFEKAGIIKKEVPVVIGESHFETLGVFKEKAQEMNASLCLAESNFILETGRIENEMLHCRFLNASNQKHIALTLDTTAFYQIKNIRTVLTAVELLRQGDLPISDTAIHEGIQNVKKLTGLKGRWDILSRKPMVIADVGHNEDGIKRCLDQLITQFKNRKIHFILGFVRDKELIPVLNLFPTEARYSFTNAHIPRALPHAELKDLAKTCGLTGDSFDDINEALAIAKKNADPDDVILICGSFFILEELKLPETDIAM